jgi:hypothetical protein
MDLFVGMKIVKAEKMTLGEFEKMSGKKMFDNSNEKAEGYLVGYCNAKDEFNGPEKDGCHYLSWSPADVFEAAYRKINN